MDFLSTIILVIAFFTLVWLYFEQKRQPKIAIPKDAKLPPHPKGVFFFGNLFQLREVAPAFQHLYMQWMRKYGTTFMFSTHTQKYIIISAEPESAQHILDKNFKNYEKSYVLKEGFYDLLGTGIFAADGELWKSERRTASHLFKTGNMKTFMFDTFLDHGSSVLDFLQKAFESNTTFNSLDLFYRYTLDSIGVIAFGKNLNCLVEPSPVSKAFDEAQYITSERFRNPVWKIMKFFGLGLEGPRMKNSISILNKFAYDLISERKLDPLVNEKPDILSMYLSKTKESDRDIRDAIMNFLIAGRDTTGQTLTWLFYCLSQNPNVEKSLLEEVDRLWNGKLPTYARLPEAKYLYAVIDETLRLYPPVPFDGKMALKPDVLPNGTYVPDHAIVIWTAYLMGRSEKYWTNPEQFDPTRWLDEKINSERHKFLHIPFQAGPRECLGKRMALFEVAILTTLILQKFTFKYVGKKPPNPIVTITINVEGGECLMKAIPRDTVFIL